MLREINISFTKTGSPKYTNELFWGNLFIGDLFLHHLGKIQTGKCQKIIIEAIDHVEREIDDYELAPSIHLVVYFVAFDFDKYESLDQPAKKRYLAAFLYHGLQQLFALKQWDPSPLEPAYDRMIDDDVVFRKTLKEKIRDPGDRTQVFQMHLVWDSKMVECFVSISNAKTGVELRRKKVFDIVSNSYTRSWKLSLNESKDTLVMGSSRVTRTYEVKISDL